MHHFEMGQVFSLQHEIITSNVQSKAIMVMIYDKRTFKPISITDFVNAPTSFTTCPVILYEPCDGVHPPCISHLPERHSYVDTVRTLHQSFKITPYQFKTFRLWMLISPTISQSHMKEVLDASRHYNFSNFQSTSAVEAASLFYDLKGISSFASALSQPTTNVRCSSPVRPFGSLAPSTLLMRRSQKATTLQTTFAVATKVTKEVSNDCDMIVDGLYIGGESAARNTTKLKDLGITHIVNLNKQDCGEVELPDGVRLFSVKMQDSEFQDLHEGFWEAVKFVTEAILTGGRVLVHCHRGISRSAALCVAYLMESRMLSFDAALNMVTQQRPIVKINQGFEEQLRAREVKPARLNMRGKKLLVNLVV